jgi:outer membrane lipoprotein SlyB
VNTGFRCCGPFTNKEITVTKIKLMLSALCIGAMGACASGPDVVTSEPGYASGYSSDYGRVVGVSYVQDRNSGVGGAIIGGIVGGVLGHQVGSGRGNDVATAAGAVGGAIVGSNIDKRNNPGGYYRVTVRTENGEMRDFNYENVGELRTGDRVRIDGNRLIRQ